MLYKLSALATKFAFLQPPPLLALETPESWPGANVLVLAFTGADL